MGHSVRKLLERYGEKNGDITGLLVAAKELDRHYIPSRYPDALPFGAPKDAYDEIVTAKCIEHAKEIISFVEKEKKRMEVEDGND